MAQHDAQANKFIQDGGLLLAFTATSASQAGFKIGNVYQIGAVAAGCLCSFQSTVTVADGGFDFFVPINETITIVATSGTLHALREGATNGSLLIAEIDSS